MLVADIQGKRIYRIPAPDKRLDKNGAPKEPKKLGRVHFPVFTPNGTRVVGFMIKLPDIVGMVKQPDKFVPLDALEMYEGVPCVVDTKENFDAPAAKRLGIDLDRCLIWTGMDVRTNRASRLGIAQRPPLIQRPVRWTISSLRAEWPRVRFWVISRCRRLTSRGIVTAR